MIELPDVLGPPAMTLVCHPLLVDAARALLTTRGVTADVETDVRMPRHAAVVWWGHRPALLTVPRHALYDPADDPVPPGGGAP